MKTKVYANNGHCILFGDTHFSREHKISCKEAMIFFRDNAVKLETETKAISKGSIPLLKRKGISKYRQGM